MSKKAGRTICNVQDLAISRIKIHSFWYYLVFVRENAGSRAYYLSSWQIKKNKNIIVKETMCSSILLIASALNKYKKEVYFYEDIRGGAYDPRVNIGLFKSVKLYQIEDIISCNPELRGVFPENFSQVLTGILGLKHVVNKQDMQKVLNAYCISFGLKRNDKTEKIPLFDYEIINTYRLLLKGIDWSVSAGYNISSMPSLTPTEVGEAFKPNLKASVVNLLLEEAGLQFKDKEKWMPTALGQAWCELVELDKVKTDGQRVLQLKWKPSLLYKLGLIGPNKQ